jgi:hypothetical protein
MKELEIYLSNFFDESTCQKLISTRVDDEKFPLFMERDGILYCAGGFIGEISYDYCEWTLDVKNTGDDDAKVVVVNWRMNVWDRQLSGSYEMNCVRGDDGNWRFTDFVLPSMAAVKPYIQLEGIE